MGYKSPEKQREYQKSWYSKNKERIKIQQAAYRKENKPRLTQWFAGIKSTLVCIRCGESHPACLQFHHRDPSTKRFAISQAIRLCVNREDILEEIRKCDVLCGNCHAKEHYPNYGGIGREI